MQKYETPRVQQFGRFRDLTLAGYGPHSDGGCLLGCTNVQNYIDPQCTNAVRS